MTEHVVLSFSRFQARMTEVEASQVLKTGTKAMLSYGERYRQDKTRRSRHDDDDSFTSAEDGYERNASVEKEDYHLMDGSLEDRKAKTAYSCLSLALTLKLTQL